MELPAVNELLADKYRIESTLGEGGFGRVVRAVDVRTGRVLAVKMLKPGRSDSVNTARFVREMRSIAALTSPHTLTLFDYGRTPEGVHYMVTELVEGLDLSELLLSRERLSPNETIHILLQVLYSLDEAHSTGLIHRDIKPSNIRLHAYNDDPLRVKVLDFGLARSFDDDSSRVTKTGRVVGTPRYMSMEQLSGSALTPAVDVFSLGLVALEMLEGRAALLDKVNYADPVQLDRSDGVSEELAALVEKMTRYQVAERYPHAKAVIADLHPLRRSVGSVAEHPPSPTLTARFSTLVHHTTSKWAGPLALSPADASPHSSSPLPRARPMWLRWVALGVLAAVVSTFVFALSWSSGDSNEAVPELTERARSALLTAAEPPPPREEDEFAGRDCTPPFTGLKAYPRRNALTFLVFVPESYTPSSPPPLVVFAPDHYFDVSSWLPRNELFDRAEEYGFVAAIVTRESSATNVIDVRSVTKVVRKAVCFDSSRIYAIGAGSGAKAVAEAGCAGDVHAFVTSGGRPKPACRRSSTSHLHFVHTKDETMPFDGADSRPLSILEDRIQRQINLRSSPWIIGQKPLAPGGSHLETREALTPCSPPDGVVDIAEFDRLWCETLGCSEVEAQATAGQCAVRRGVRGRLQVCGVDGGRIWAPDYPPHARCFGEPSSDFDYFATIWAFLSEQ